eukprot:CAMPEP_0194243132 /NCGR_PEP_ID=MMETSP0158-20130606/8446_1 /TAXON_ID=33649 /ORGANISM="Thalassionema nitzschioides, Strain L26-B" /LENGTH=227 /DNA_ID=CAMNT_0038978357 /DNA_START=166 /DNA_END=846 /DNA_ORIENTATION=-
MEQVIDDNNQGLYYYEAGQLENASSCFRNALYGISLLRDVSIQNSDFPQFAQHICSPIKGWSLPAKSSKKTSDEGFSLPFSRIMLLQDCNAQPASLFRFNVVTLAILFNSAVVNHAYSDSHGQITEAIEAAYEGYENAFMILENLIDDPDRSSSSFSLHSKIVRAALFNNMGALFHNNLCRYRDATRCFRSYQHMMGVMDKQVLQNGFITTEELLQLSMNLLVVPIT